MISPLPGRTDQSTVRLVGAANLPWNQPLPGTGMSLVALYMGRLLSLTAQLHHETVSNFKRAAQGYSRNRHYEMDSLIVSEQAQKQSLVPWSMERCNGATDFLTYPIRNCIMIS